MQLLFKICMFEIQLNSKFNNLRDTNRGSSFSLLQIGVILLTYQTSVAQQLEFELSIYPYKLFDRAMLALTWWKFQAILNLVSHVVCELRCNMSGSVDTKQTFKIENKESCGSTFLCEEDEFPNYSSHPSSIYLIERLAMPCSVSLVTALFKLVFHYGGDVEYSKLWTVTMRKSRPCYAETSSLPFVEV